MRSNFIKFQLKFAHGQPLLRQRARCAYISDYKTISAITLRDLRDRLHCCGSVPHHIAAAAAATAVALHLLLPLTSTL